MRASASTIPVGFTRERPTARELYIGCNLMRIQARVEASNNGVPFYSATYCGYMIGAALKSDKTLDVAGKHFCIPAIIQDSDKPKMADEYIAFYDKVVAPNDLADGDGPTAFYSAMVTKWPCVPVKAP